MAQLSYTNAAAAMREGQIADGSLHQPDSFVVESGTVKAGLLAEYGTGDRQLQPMSALAAADVDAIKTTFSSATTETTYATTALNGATGQGRIAPAKSVTFTADSHADWGLAALGGTWVTIAGVDAAGKPVSERLFIPNGGNVTLITEHAYSRVTKVIIGPNDGTGGSGTIGISNDLIEVGKATHPGVPVYDPYVEPVSSSGEYDQYDQVNCLRKGRFAAVTEHDVVEGEEVFVRIAAAGADVRGQFTGDTGATDAATYAKVLGARWRESASADELAMLEIDFT